MKPGSLVQIHYHNRPGGVTSVIRAYAQTFAAIAGPGAPNIVICCDYDDTAASVAPARVVPVAGLDYQSFSTAAAVKRASALLVRALESALADEALTPPVCIVAHNFNLGKNVAASDAFAQIAVRITNSVFAVVHDMAEDGRDDLLRRMHTLKSDGFDIQSVLYPRNGVEFVTPSHAIRDRLRVEKLPVVLLSNPIEFPHVRRSLSRSMHDEFGCVCAQEAKRRGAVFCNEKQVVFYPGRVIARKNPVEAVIVGCIVLDGNLLMGARGTSSADRRLTARLERLCNEYALPFLPDCDELRRKHAWLRTEARSFMALSRFSDCCLSTSVLEGFGYALYEPWLYGQSVVGRRPHGHRAAGKVRLGHFYDSMNVPVAWTTSHGTGRRTSDDGAMVDFARLPLTNQLEILGRLAKAPECISSLKFSRGKRQMSVRQLRALAFGKPGRVLMEHNRAVIEVNLSPDAFRGCFGRIFITRRGNRVITNIRKRYS